MPYFTPEVLMDLMGLMDTWPNPPKNHLWKKVSLISASFEKLSKENMEGLFCLFAIWKEMVLSHRQLFKQMARAISQCLSFFEWISQCLSFPRNHGNPASWRILLAEKNELVEKCESWWKTILTTKTWRRQDTSGSLSLYQPILLIIAISHKQL